ncbi:PAS domain-containing sensor histidine kinase [Azospirillum picis]|uniref:histidine kinase n=1 Tax=Azospirillum picis TaxID=488438 RepID=A0ABU0MLL5_9PROT|nr:PAS domain-containing sensor histidine kinase [Azospirillum picis]MBP2300448.1 PAS domain-containing protein/nitrogen-specific signal transduction histidine kinase [Azospirillum picis]MDQ0534244.1 PAS domain-containing protein/nitrogen-specific signal transduction histidine kinase [Azospirillum picis]
MFRNKDSRRQAEHAADGDRWRALLAAAPLPCCAWSVSGEAFLSDEAAALLGISSADGLGSALPAADLRAAVDRLRREGKPFRCEASGAGGRRLMLAGRRGSAGAERFDVIWIEDITAAHDAAGDAARRQAAEVDAIRSRLDGLRAVADALPVPMWVRDRDLRLSWCNRAYARAVDSDPETAVAEGRELATAARSLAERARGGGFAQSERVPVVIGTERRLLEVTEAPLPAGDGGIPVVGYALDVTALQELRGELDRHLTAHAEVLERLSTAIAIFGPDTRLTFFNQAYARLWDLDEAWLRTEPTNAELLEELRARRRLPEYADYQTFKRERLTRYTRLVEPLEELLHLPDGTTLRHLAAPHPQGGLITILEDVTNTLALESSYNTLMAVQQETLDNLAEGIAVFGGDGRLKLSNPAFARIWDLAEADLRGEPHIAEVIERMRPLLDAPQPPEKAADAAGGAGPANSAPTAGPAAGWEALKEELVGATLERSVRSGRMERSDGSVVEFSTLPLPDGAVLNSYLDVTDGARLETALRASNAALEAADQLKTEFISNVSHHLRTPLNGIIGFAEVLSNQYFGQLNERQMEYVRGMLSAGQRLLELIDDVVDLTSLGAGVTTLERGAIALPDLLESVAGLTKDWARREGLRMEVVAPEALGEIEGDGKRLKQALFTLVVGAIRNPPSDRRIRLAGERLNGSVTLSVSGAALPESDPQGAAALGVSLARNVVELHGGRLELDETAGRGAHVRCIMPVRAPVNGVKA